MFRVLLVVAVVTAVTGCSKKTDSSSSVPKAPLYDNLGNYHYAIATASADAQKYFDQGMTLAYAFNHAEALRAFSQATSLDPFALPAAWSAAPDGPELVAFASHVDLGAQERARRAGYHRVLARSAFVRELPELLTRPRGDPAPPGSSHS